MFNQRGTTVATDAVIQWAEERSDDDPKSLLMMLNFMMDKIIANPESPAFHKVLAAQMKEDCESALAAWEPDEEDDPDEDESDDEDGDDEDEE